MPSFPYLVLLRRDNAVQWGHLAVAARSSSAFSLFGGELAGTHRPCSQAFPKDLGRWEAASTWPSLIRTSWSLCSHVLASPFLYNRTRHHPGCASPMTGGKAWRLLSASRLPALMG